jgi:hypothetical protein
LLSAAAYRYIAFYIPRSGLRRKIRVPVISLSREIRIELPQWRHRFVQGCTHSFSSGAIVGRSLLAFHSINAPRCQMPLHTPSGSLAEQYRNNAQDCARQAENAPSEIERRRILTLQKAWLTLADHEEWRQDAQKAPPPLFRAT